MRELVRKEHEMKKQRAHDRCKMETSQMYSNAATEEGILLKEIKTNSPTPQKKKTNNKQNNNPNRRNQWVDRCG